MSEFIFQEYVGSTRSPIGLQDVKWLIHALGAYKGLPVDNIQTLTLRPIFEHIDLFDGSLVEAVSSKWLADLIDTRLNDGFEPEELDVRPPHLCLEFKQEPNYSDPDRLVFGVQDNGEYLEFYYFGLLSDEKALVPEGIKTKEILIFDNTFLLTVNLRHLVSLVNSGITASCTTCEVSETCPLLTLGNVRERMRGIANGELDKMDEAGLLSLFENESLRKKVQNLIRVLGIKFIGKDDSSLGPKEIKIVRVVADLISHGKDVDVDTVFNLIPASDNDRPVHRWIRDVINERMPCLQEGGRCDLSCRYHQIESGCPVQLVIEP